METPLNLQLNYGSHQSYMELRLVQMRDTLASPPSGSAAKSKVAHRGVRPGRGGDGDSDSDESNDSSPNDVIPKEEGIQY